MKSALLFYGGWEGHDPERISARLERILKENGFTTERHDTVDCLADRERLASFDLIVPAVTMGEMSYGIAASVSYAVEQGTGLCGCHGGLCDAFRTNTLWQFITGGQFVDHPGGGSTTYNVHMIPGKSPITDGIGDFTVTSEQYYLHIDPAVNVLATTRFPVKNGPHAANGAVDMPVAWTKYWGLGRIFYLSLCHTDEDFVTCPQAEIMMTRGMLWASDGKKYAAENGLTAETYRI